MTRIDAIECNVSTDQLSWKGFRTPRARPAFQTLRRSTPTLRPRSPAPPERPISPPALEPPPPPLPFSPPEPPDRAMASDVRLVESSIATAGGVTAAKRPHFLRNSRRSSPILESVVSFSFLRMCCPTVGVSVRTSLSEGLIRSLHQQRRSRNISIGIAGRLSASGQKLVSSLSKRYRPEIASKFTRDARQLSTSRPMRLAAISIPR